jgi:hypothetical protein
MLDTRNLFRSDGGIELVAEICLAIAEYAIVDEPMAATALLSVSKVRPLIIIHPFLDI